MDEVEDKSHRNSKCFKSQDNIELGAPETHSHTPKRVFQQSAQTHSTS